MGEDRLPRKMLKPNKEGRSPRGIPTVKQSTVMEEIEKRCDVRRAMKSGAEQRD